MTDNKRGKLVSVNSTMPCIIILKFSVNCDHWLSTSQGMWLCKLNQQNRPMLARSWCYCIVMVYFCPVPASAPIHFTGSKHHNGEGNGTPLQYSCLENPMGGGAWSAAVHGVAKSQTRLSDFIHFSFSCIGEGNGNPLQCSCLENPRDGGAWWAAVCGVA